VIALPRRFRLSVLLVTILFGFAGRRAALSAEQVNILFAYSSEKDGWLKTVTKNFNDTEQTVDGAVIRVMLQPMGSAELLAALKNDDLKPHLVSPASKLFLNLAEPEFLGPTRSLVNSPVVIAIWENKARALGWPEKALGWEDVFNLATRKTGWADLGHPEWGRFKFGHTDPELNNSGLSAVVAQVYAAAGKTAALTVADVDSPETAKMLSGIGRSVAFYGSSTGFLATRTTEQPDALDAAALYENMVIAHNGKPGAPRLLAVYPREGTFISDHPVGIVNKQWVGTAERKAAEQYISFLLDDAQQKKALAFGFRPGSAAVPLSAPIDADHGVDPQQPAKLLEVPSDAVLRACQEAWRKAKKPANVYLVVGARAASDRAAIKKLAVGIIEHLGEKDRLSILLFNQSVHFLARERPARTLEDREELIHQLQIGLASIRASDQFQLVEAILLAYNDLASHQLPDGRIQDPAESLSTIIVLSDGEHDNAGSDHHGNTTPSDLDGRIKFDQGITILPVVFGKDGLETMRQIARYVGFGPLVAPLPPPEPGPQDLDPMKKADYERKKQVYETESESLIDDLAEFFSGRGPAAAPPPR
jgi:Ca-activated chloride channel family protein